MFQSEFPQPEWNDANSVQLALKALREARDEESAVDACDRFLWAVGDNEVGSFYPVVLTVFPEIEQILASGGSWSRQAAIEALIDLGGTFGPAEGFETHGKVEVQDALRTFIRTLRPRLLPLTAGSDALARSAGELVELIDDLVA